MRVTSGKFYRKDHCLGGSGVFIGICNWSWLDSSSESLWVKILLAANLSLYICSFYRPPNNDPISLNQLSNAIATLYENASPQTNIIIAGDFNVPDIIWTKGIGQVKPIPSYGTAVNYSLLDLASDYHLEQLMHENTRRNHILDLVFCTNPSYVSNVNVVPGISDHEAVSFCFNSTPLTYEKSTRTIYLYN